MKELIIITEDGSSTLFSPDVEETYHSQKGAIQESEHIFIKTGWEECLKNDLKVFEVGFGTGLNAFMTLLKAEEDQKKVLYTSLEYYPINSETVQHLNYTELLNNDKKNDFHKLHTTGWNNKETISCFFTLEKIKADFTCYNLKDNYDLFYFDAFSPEKQPEMWTQERFEHLFNHANPGAILVTYCSKGAVRRAMQAAGFITERLPGPPGKREILRARKA